jgi:uncharacterized protein YecT (DUF1311 family)
MALFWIGLPCSPALHAADEQRRDVTPGNADSAAQSLSQVQTAIDTIYAHYGVVFPNPKVQAWADHQPWYRPVVGRTPEIAEGMFTQADKDQVNQLADQRRRLLAASQSPRDGNAGVSQPSTSVSAISIDSFVKPDGNLDGNGIGKYLTDAYQKCLAEAPAKQREQIRVPQRAWIVFSNKTETALNGLGKPQDEVWKLELQECLARANELQQFYRPPSKSMDELKGELDHAEGILTTVYQQSLSTLTEGSRKDLIEAERSWVEFKEKNLKANAIVNPGGSGIEATILVVKDRVAELKSIYGADNNSSVAQDSQRVAEPSVPAQAMPQPMAVPAATPQPATPALATPEATTPAPVMAEAATPAPLVADAAATPAPLVADAATPQQANTPPEVITETPTPVSYQGSSTGGEKDSGFVGLLVGVGFALVVIFGLLWLEARSSLILEHPNTGIIKKAPIGFSWSTLMFPAWSAFFRADWKAFFLQLLTDYVFVLGLVIWPFIYNKMYLNKLLERGFKVKEVRGMTLDRAKKRLGINLPQL